jgi:daunorubicin resistance ABC transporter ATP-binding subunit
MLAEGRKEGRKAMSHLIEVENLVKVYPDGTKAVDDVSFHVSTGEIYGFLGPNGAGKTTIIRILVTLLPKTSGSARVNGIEVDRDPEAVRKLIGYAAQFIGVDDDLTGRENLVLQGRLHGMGRLDSKRRADELLEVFSLQEAADKRVGAFSGGMRRRLDLAQALVHRPALLFLDEPTTGLDPQTRNALWRYLEELNREGTTIFLTTQYMEEADRMSHRLAIIDRGTVVVSDSPASLKQEIGGDVITLTLPDDAGEDLRARALEAMTAFPGAGEPTVFDHSVALPVKDGGRALSDLVRRLDEQKVPIAQLSLTTPTLDEVFLRYTGERLRVEEASQRTTSSTFAVTAGRRRR